MAMTRKSSFPLPVQRIGVALCVAVSAVRGGNMKVAVSAAFREKSRIASLRRFELRSAFLRPANSGGTALYSFLSFHRPVFLRGDFLFLRGGQIL